MKMRKVAFMLLFIMLFEAFNISVMASDYDSWSSKFTTLWSDDFESYTLGRVDGKKNTSLAVDGIMTWRATTGSEPYETFSIVNSPVSNDGRGNVLSFEGRATTEDGVTSFSGANNLEFQSSSDTLEESTKVKVSFDLYMTAGRYFQFRLYDGTSSSVYWNVFTVKDDLAMYVSGSPVGSFETNKWNHIDIYLDFESSLCDVYLDENILKGGVAISNISCMSDGRITVNASDSAMTYFDNLDISMFTDSPQVVSINDGYTKLWTDSFESYDINTKASNLKINNKNTWNAGGGSGQLGVKYFNAEHSQVLDFNGANVVQSKNTIENWEHINKAKRIKISFDFYVGENSNLLMYLCGTDSNSNRVQAFQVADDANRTMRFNAGSYTFSDAAKADLEGNWHHVVMYYNFDTMKSTAYYDSVPYLMDKGFSGPECFYKIRFEYPGAETHIDNFEISVLNSLWEDDFEDYEIKEYKGELVHNSDTPAWKDSNTSALFDIIDLQTSHKNVLSLKGVYDNSSNQYINGNTITSYDLNGIMLPYSCRVELDVYFENYRTAELRLAGNNGKDYVTVAKFSNKGNMAFPNTASGTQMAYQEDTWYTITIDIDFSKKSHSVQVNGKQLFTDEQFESESLFLKAVTFQVGPSDPIKPVYLDNVRIFADPSCVMDVLSDNRMVFSYDDFGAVQISALSDNSEESLIIATYKDGRMIEANILNSVNSENSELGNIFSYTKSLESGVTMKGFWFDSIENIRPINQHEIIYDPTDEDFEEALECWSEYLLGVDVNDGSKVSSKIGSITSSAQKYSSTINTDTSKNYLWETYPLENTANMTSTYKNIFCMALAWGTEGSTLYHNSDLLETIKYAVDYMYENCYGEDEINGNGWKSIWEHNWWDWMVGTGQYLLDTMVILQDEYTDDEIHQYTELFGYINSVMDVQVNKKNAQEKAYIACEYAVLTKNKKLLKDMMNRYSMLFSFTDEGNGVYSDYSYLYHNNIPYTSVYGLYFDRTLPVLKVLENMNLCNGNEFYDFVADYILNGFEPLVYNGGLMAMTAGRNFSRGDEQYNCVTLLRSIIDIIDHVDDDKAEKLKKLVKRIAENSGSNLYYTDSRMYLSHVSKLEEILNDSSIANEDYIGSKVFYNMDRTVWQRGDYAAGLAMSSSRIPNYESCNQDNTQGWYTGDGMLYLYHKDDKEQYDVNYADYADPYKRPGTTVDTQLRDDVSIRVGDEYFSSQDFVGGVQIDDMYSVSAMSLESFHNSKQSSVVDNGAGGGLPVHSSSLTAKKSYFMFDDEIVCLGSDIDANDGYNVLTVVENKKLKADATTIISIDGSNIRNTSGNKANAKYAAFKDGSGGYYFPSGANLNYRKVANEKYFFEMWIDHGVNPDNANYSYVLLPGKNESSTLQYSLNPDITVLSNNESIHAVSENKLGMTGIVFWSAGKNSGIEVSEPLAVIKKNTDKGIVLAVSDPTQKLQNVTIKIDGIYSLKNIPENVVVSSVSGQTILSIDLSGISGETVQFELTTN